jgi:threonine/homoserine efflux transporter RhtA
MSGIDQLGGAMLAAAIVATPIGIADAAPTLTHPTWLAWGIGVGLCSSVIPYVTDQLAMARLPRATFPTPRPAPPAGTGQFQHVHPSQRQTVSLLRWLQLNRGPTVGRQIRPVVDPRLR